MSDTTLLDQAKIKYANLIQVARTKVHPDVELYTGKPGSRSEGRFFLGVPLTGRSYLIDVEEYPANGIFGPNQLSRKKAIDKVLAEYKEYLALVEKSYPMVEKTFNEWNGENLQDLAKAFHEAAVIKKYEYIQHPEHRGREYASVGTREGMLFWCDQVGKKRIASFEEKRSFLRNIALVLTNFRKQCEEAGIRYHVTPNVQAQTD